MVERRSMTENSNVKEDIKFNDLRKYTYEYFKQMATFSISLIALYGGLVRFSSPEKPISLLFLVGITLLFLAVIYNSMGIFIVLYSYKPENTFGIIVLGSLWLSGTFSFFAGLFFLLGDFTEEKPELIWYAVIIIIVLTIILIVGLFVFLFLLKIYRYNKVRQIIDNKARRHYHE